MTIQQRLRKDFQFGWGCRQNWEGVIVLHIFYRFLTEKMLTFGVVFSSISGVIPPQGLSGGITAISLKLEFGSSVCHGAGNFDCFYKGFFTVSEGKYQVVRVL